MGKRLATSVLPSIQATLSKYADAYSVQRLHARAMRESCRVGPGAVMAPIFRNITRGQVRRCVDFGHVSLREVDYSPGTTFRPHAHQTSNITLLLRGGIAERGDGVDAFARCCSIVLKPAGAVHSNQLGESGARSLVVEFDPEWLVGVAGAPAAPSQMRVSTSVPAAAIVLRMRKTLLESASPTDSTAAETGVIDLIRLLESEAGRFAPVTTGSGIPDAVRTHVERDPCMQESFERLAGRLGVHQVSLSRSFRRRFGRTPVEHRRLLRVQKAAEWIASSATPLAQIAVRAGFSDQSHLTRAFSRDLGVSPGRFREYAAGS